MIPLSKAAEAALEALADHYAALGRDRAIDRLVESLEAARERYANDPDDFLAAPRPYPGLADLGFLWTKQGPLLDRLRKDDERSGCRRRLPRHGKYSAQSLTSRA